jgi:hypothetical protein
VHWGVPLPSCTATASPHHPRLPAAASSCVMSSRSPKDVLSSTSPVSITCKRNADLTCPLRKHVSHDCTTAWPLVARNTALAMRDQHMHCNGTPSSLTAHNLKDIVAAVWWSRPHQHADQRCLCQQERGLALRNLRNSQSMKCWLFAWTCTLKAARMSTKTRAALPWLAAAARWSPPASRLHTAQSMQWADGTGNS